MKVIGTESVLRLTTESGGRSRARLVTRWPLHRLSSPHGERRRNLSRPRARRSGAHSLTRHVWEAIGALEGLGWSPDGKFLAFSEEIPGQELTRISVLSVESLDKRAVTSPPPSVGPRGLLSSFLSRRTNSRLPPSIQRRRGGGVSCFCYGRRAKAADIRQRPHRGAYLGPRRRASHLFIIERRHLRVCGRSPWREARLSSSSWAERMPSSPRSLAMGEASPTCRSFDDTNIWRFEVPRAPGRAKPPTKLIASTEIEAEQQFSPDGKRIVFASSRSGNCCEIWVCESDGSKPVQLTNFGGPIAGTPRWSPDGRQVVLDCNAGGNEDIYVVSVEGGPPRRLTSEKSEDVTPSWSRDGRWIYFASDRTGNWQVWKLPAEGGKAVQVTKGGGFAAFESYDGKTLYYAKGRDSSWAVEGARGRRRGNPRP